jgi:hypothetical protein
MQRFSIWVPLLLVVWAPEMRAQPMEIEDSAVFRAVVAEGARDVDGELLVDPRELREGADLTAVDEMDVGPASGARTAVLEGLRVRTSDFTADQRCLFARGLPPAPEFQTDSQRETRAACLRRFPFTALIVGRPTRSTDDGGRRTTAVTVVRMTMDRYSVRELRLANDGAGWTVVDSRTLIDVTS